MFFGRKYNRKKRRKNTLFVWNLKCTSFNKQQILKLYKDVSRQLYNIKYVSSRSIRDFSTIRNCGKTNLVLL